MSINGSNWQIIQFINKQHNYSLLWTVYKSYMSLLLLRLFDSLDLAVLELLNRNFWNNCRYRLFRWESKIKASLVIAKIESVLSMIRVKKSLK